MKSHLGTDAETCTENELILSCLRTSFSPDVALDIRKLVQGKLEWNYLLRTASRHGLIPLLYRQLLNTCIKNIPEDLWGQLQERVQENAAWNMLLTSELLKILSLLESQGIPAIPFKGPALAAFIYGNIALRQFCDIDILVRQSDLLKAKDLLLSQGYQTEFPLSGTRERDYLKSCQDHHYHFVHPDTEVLVELHWEITPKSISFPMAPQDLWERVEGRSLAGQEIRTFLPEELLLIICVHGAKHCWARLLWVCDVAQLIEVTRGMDWQRVMKLAERLGCERMLFLGLYLAQTLAGASIPAHIQPRIQADSLVKSLARQVFKKLFQQSPHHPMAELLFHLQLRERPRDRIRDCLHFAFNPSAVDWALLPLPPCLSFFYYLLRPVRLLRDYRLNTRKIELALAKEPD